MFEQHIIKREKWGRGAAFEKVVGSVTRTGFVSVTSGLFDE